MQQPIQVNQPQEIPIGEDKLTVMPLGAGQEVGRSSIILKYHGHRIMLDCGIHPAYENQGGLPFIDAIDPGKIDVLLITHFHIDHITAVPWFLTQTNFKGPCYMTHATKAISKTLLLDYVGVSSRGSEEPNLFTRADVSNCQSMITPVTYHQTVTHGSVKMTCYPAGHVLGACMWLVEIDGVKVLYTGDFSLEDERHLQGAEIPKMNGETIPPDVLIIESTHGLSRIEPREEREYRFIDNVTKIIKRGGRCLIPIFALGRAQELLLILDEYWESKKEKYGKVPIYYGSNLAKKSIDVYNTYYQPSHTSKVVTSKGKFDFQHIKYIRDADFDDSMPCVVLCSPAMLQNGLSRKIFEAWCSNPVNGLIIPGYIVDGTLPQKLVKNPAEIETLSGKMIPRRISIDYVSFSGHADFNQTSRFITELKPKKIVLIHGVAGSMMALKDKLLQMFMEDGIQVFTPALCEKVEMYFQSNPSAIVTGALSDEKEHLSGLIVRKDGQNMIMSSTDLSSHTTLKTISAKMNLEVSLNLPLLQYVPLLSSYFADVRIVSKILVLVSERLLLREKANNMVVLSWDADPTLDLLADNVAMILQTFDQPDTKFQSPQELFVSKLQEALRERYLPDIEFEPDSQLFMFNYKDADFVIAMDPDAANGVNVECTDPEKESIVADINALALQIYEFANPLLLHSTQR